MGGGGGKHSTTQNMFVVLVFSSVQSLFFCPGVAENDQVVVAASEGRVY